MAVRLFVLPRLAGHSNPLPPPNRLRLRERDRGSDDGRGGSGGGGGRRRISSSVVVLRRRRHRSFSFFIPRVELSVRNLEHNVWVRGRGGGGSWEHGVVLRVGSEGGGSVRCAGLGTRRVSNTMASGSGRYSGKTQQQQRPLSAVVAESARAPRDALRPPASARASSASASSAKNAAGSMPSSDGRGNKRFSMFMQVIPGVSGRPSTANFVRSQRAPADSAEWYHSLSDSDTDDKKNTMKLSSAPARRMHKLLATSNDARERLSVINKRQKYTSPYAPSRQHAGRHPSSARPPHREVRRKDQ